MFVFYSDLISVKIYKSGLLYIENRLISKTHYPDRKAKFEGNNGH